MQFILKARQCQQTLCQISRERKDFDLKLMLSPSLSLTHSYTCLVNSAYFLKTDDGHSILDLRDNGDLKNKGHFNFFLKAFQLEQGEGNATISMGHVCIVKASIINFLWGGGVSYKTFWN